MFFSFRLVPALSPRVMLCIALVINLNFSMFNDEYREMMILSLKFFFVEFVIRIFIRQKTNGIIRRIQWFLVTKLPVLSNKSVQKYKKFKLEITLVLDVSLIHVWIVVPVSKIKIMRCCSVLIDDRLI